MLEYGYSKAAICRKLKCNPKTLDDHLRRMSKNNVLLKATSISIFALTFCVSGKSRIGSMFDIGLLTLWLSDNLMVINKVINGYE